MGYYSTRAVKLRILEGVPIDGDSIEFHRALRELRADGYVITYNRKTGMYQYTGERKEALQRDNPKTEGAAPMNEIEAIEVLESVKRNEISRNEKINRLCINPSKSLGAEAIDIAIQALQAQLDHKQQPEPLTPEQLKVWLCTKDWIYIKDDRSETVVNIQCWLIDLDSDKALKAVNVTGKSKIFFKENYGNTWWAYTRKPRQEP